MILEESYREEVIERLKAEPDSVFDSAGMNKTDILKDKELIDGLWYTYQKDVEEYDTPKDEAWLDALNEELGIEIPKTLGRYMESTILEMGQEPAAYKFAAMAVVLDRGMVDDITTSDWDTLVALAAAIEKGMCSHDEPRFTLYDYLDAVIDDNLSALLKFGKKNEEKFFERIVEAAAHKRAVYES